MQALRRATLLACLLARAAQAQDGAPLRTAVDGTFAFPSLSGGVQGFSVELFTEVARRLHRRITFDSASYSSLIPALDAGRYDFLAAPTTVTRERAENLLFASGYMWTAFQFGIKETRAEWAAPFRKDEAVLRKQIQDALSCMKQDGSFAKLSERQMQAGI